MSACEKSEEEKERLKISLVVASKPLFFFVIALYSFLSFPFASHHVSTRSSVDYRAIQQKIRFVFYVCCVSSLLMMRVCVLRNICLLTLISTVHQPQPLIASMAGINNLSILLPTVRVNECVIVLIPITFDAQSQFNKTRFYEPIIQISN